jgi:hypothetical protein
LGLKELKTKNNVRKNSKRSLRASYLHDKALQTLFRGDNRVSKLYNCSNKPVNASDERLVSECCTVFFYLSVLLRLFCIINALHVGVEYLSIYLLCRILGIENFFGGVDILFGGVIANIRVAPPCTPPPRKSVYVANLPGKSVEKLVRSSMFYEIRKQACKQSI